jgi:hypothetical protein
MNNPLNRGVCRVDSRLLLLLALDDLARNGSTSVNEPADKLGCRGTTLQGLFGNARQHFDVRITYRRTNQPYVRAVEFSIEDRGVFD